MKISPVSHQIGSNCSSRLTSSKRIGLTEHVPSGEILMPRSKLGIPVVYDRCRVCKKYYERIPTEEEMEAYKEKISRLGSEIFSEGSRELDIFA